MYQKTPHTMLKLIRLTILLVIFLFTTQIAHGQKYYVTTPSIGKTCIPNTFLDSMIHDIQVGKVLKSKDSLSTAYIWSIEKNNTILRTNVSTVEKSLLKSENKRSRNGWQRNTFIVISLVLGGLLLR